MLFIQYPQKINDDKIAQQIMALENTAWPKDLTDKVFPSAPNTYVTSFVLMDNDIAVCHVGVRKSILFHNGNRYLAYGLSEVVTYPQYQKQGLATKTINIVKQFILAQKPDISIFTCA